MALRSTSIFMVDLMDRISTRPPSNTASVKVNTFYFRRALSYIGLILAGVSTDDDGKCG